MKNQKFTCLRYTLTTLCFFLLVGVAQAAFYYAAPSGNAGWSNAVNIESPCSVYTAMDNAKAGDTVYFRGGQYDFPYVYASTWAGIIHPANSGIEGSPIVFMAYPGETPVWNVTGAAANQYTTLFSSAGHEYITLDGFTVKSSNGLSMTSIAIHGNSGATGSRKKGCVVQNMNIDGGNVFSTSNNREGLRIEDVDGAIVRNNTIYNYSGSDDNYAGIKSYDTVNCIFEHNYIYNCTRGIYSKSNMNGAVIRFNYIVDTNVGIYDNSYIDQRRTSNNNIIHDNLIVNATYMGIRWRTEDGVTDDGNHFFNNTIYEVKHGITIGDGTGWMVYNNIIRRKAGTSGHHVNLGTNYSLKKFDHNLYDSSLDFHIRTHFEVSGGSDYTTLASWQASGELQNGANPGNGSIYADPQYENYSGSMSEKIDFKLKASSPGYQAGLGGIDMGANIDLVGLIDGGGTGGVGGSEGSSSEIPQDFRMQ